MRGRLHDAALVIQHRHHFADLGQALALLGVTLEPRAVAAAAEPGPELVVPVEADDEARVFDAEQITWEGEYSTEVLADLVEASTLDHLAGPSGQKRQGPPPVGSGPSPALVARAARAENVICSILRPDSVPVGPPRPAYVSVEPPQTSRSDPPSVLSPTTLAARLYSLTKVPRRTNRPDLDVVLKRLVLGETLDHVPAERVPAAPPELIVLVERGLRVGPCAQDCHRIMATLQSILGRSVARAWGFAVEDQLMAGPGPLWTWRPIADHEMTTPVLILAAARSARDGGAVDGWARRRWTSDVPVSMVLFGADDARRHRPYPSWAVDD